jgi:hypothetical protein
VKKTDWTEKLRLKRELCTVYSIVEQARTDDDRLVQGGISGSVLVPPGFIHWAGKC